MTTPTPSPIEGNALATTIVAILTEAPSPEWTSMAAHLTQMLLPPWANEIFSRGLVCLNPDPDTITALFREAGWDVHAEEVETKITERQRLSLGFKATDLKTVFSLAPPAPALQERFMWAMTEVGEETLVSYTDPRRCVSFIAPNRRAGPYWLTACRINGKADMVSATGDTEGKALVELETMVRDYCIEMALEAVAAR